MTVQNGFVNYRSRLSAILMVCIALGFTVQLQAQSPGNDVVYNASGVVASSTAYVDASVFSGSDICAIIYNALIASTTPTTGVVIDARGINTPSLLTCTSTETPWVSGSSSTTKPAIILLPAGTISISTSWMLPNQTKLIGEGPGKTTILASGFTNNTWMIYMGSSTLCPSTGGCTGVQVKDLALSGQGATTNMAGIINEWSQDLSFVHNVSTTGLPGGVLFISGIGNPGSALNSGPYTNISYSISSSALGTGCVQLSHVSTRGISGLTCTNKATTAAPGAAVSLESSSNNVLENVSIQGWSSGISILGPGGVPANANTLINIQGNTKVSNLVQLQTGTGDVTILGANLNGGAHSIDDVVTNTVLSDSTVAMYVLGQPVTIAGSTAYTRFTTSPNAPTWAVLNGGNSSSLTGTCATGSILTDKQGATGSSDTMLDCVGGNDWTVIY